jgi:hypothetical protein
VKITSPIGEYDYRVDRVSLRNGQVEVRGHLGQWKTTTVIERSDLIALGLRAAPVLGAFCALCLVTRRLRRV